MQRTTSNWLLRSTGVFLTAGIVACSAPVIDDGGTDANPSDVTDGGAHDVIDAQTHDAQPDAQPDVAIDTGTDASADVAADTVDAASDVPSDAVDASVLDVAVDTGSDATADVVTTDTVTVDADDASADVTADVSGDVTCSGGGLMCGGSCVSGGTVAQIDISALFNEDIIVNNGSGALDPTQDPIDGSNYAAITQSATVALGGGGGVGLPDDGFFAANASHPDVQLAYRNTDDGNNARRVLPGTVVTIDVPDRPYSQLQIFAFSTEGSSPVTFTIHYCDGTSDTRSVTIPDWYNDSPPAFPAGVFYLINGMDRAGLSPITLDFAHDPAAFGYSLNPATTQVVTSVDVLLSAAATTRFHLLGATGQ